MDRVAAHLVALARAIDRHGLGELAHRALAGQKLRGGSADARSGARHQHDLACNPAHGFLPNFLVATLEAAQAGDKQGGRPMARTLEFYYDYGSPYSYLADTQVDAIAKRAGAALARKPMLLGGVFKATGNASPMTVELKSKWSTFDLPMWARYYGVPFN